MRTSRGISGHLSRSRSNRWTRAEPLLLGLALSPFLYLLLRVTSLERLIAVLLGLSLIAVAAWRPDRALIGLVALLPFQTLLLAKLYGWGLPISVVRPLAGWKEALAIGVVIAGVQGFRSSRARLDSLDLMALAFIVATAAYALAPTVFAPAAPTDLDVRSLGFRQGAGFVVLLIGARYARFPAGSSARVMKVALGAGLIVAALGLYEFIFSEAWNRFVVQTLEYPAYQVQVLQVYPPSTFDYRSYGLVAGGEVLRVGSVFLDPLSCGFYLVIGFAIALERAVRRVSGPGLLALLLMGSGILLTQTRSAIVAALIVAALAFQVVAGRRRHLRLQVAIVVAAGVILALPAAASTGLSQRATTTKSSTDPSATDHLDQLRQGLNTLGAHPLGLGLGTSAGVGQRFTSSGEAIVSENNYIQIGIEIGVVSMAIFIGATVLLVRELRRAARRVPDPAVAAISSAALGLAVGAFFLQTWNDIPTAWTLWGLAGLALSLARGGAELQQKPGRARPGARRSVPERASSPPEPPSEESVGTWIPPALTGEKAL